MSQTLSPSAQRPYGLARVCRVWEIARSTVYAAQARQATPRMPQRRGPKGPWSDEALLAAIREVLAATSFVGEGHRKGWARLRYRGIRASKDRVLRLMRAARLLAPTRAGHAHGPAAHDGTIVTDQPDVMWGMDATSAVTRLEGTATIFVAIDHCTAECIGLHAAKPGTRFEALEPVRQGLHAIFGSYTESVAAGLQARHDHGSVYLSDVFQDELRFLGIVSSPAFVREPEGNGCAERFIRTLKEQLLWLQTFDTVEELRLALLAFKDRYNREWLIERHGHQTPAARRAAFTAGSTTDPAAAAA
jgi:transposase InsO family protein